MQSGVRFIPQDLKRVQKDIYALGKKVGDKVVLDALKQGAWLVANDARSRAPKKTGRLGRHITVRKSKIHTRRRGRIGAYVTIRKMQEDLYYGRIQHDGWNTRGKRNGNRRSITKRFGKRTGRNSSIGRTNVPGKEFIDTAYRVNKEKALKLIIIAIHRGAKLVANKAGFKYG